MNSVENAMTEPTIAGWNESIHITRGECEAGLAAVEMQREYFTRMVALMEEYKVELRCMIFERPWFR
jgi:hypothetical protein